ncbi:hypothetical protein CB1_000684004 [Camelus ferus]|nr:hypothetical protein CB1_000684004 [Camelus ferus]
MEMSAPCQGGGLDKVTPTSIHLELRTSQYQSNRAVLHLCSNTLNFQISEVQPEYCARVAKPDSPGRVADAPRRHLQRKAQDGHVVRGSVQSEAERKGSSLPSPGEACREETGLAAGDGDGDSQALSEVGETAESTDVEHSSGVSGPASRGPPAPSAPPCPALAWPLRPPPGGRSQ